MKTVITSEYEALFRQHFRLATLYAERIVGSAHEAEDIVQEVFIALLDVDFSQIRQKESYLYRCVRNAALDHLHARMKNRFYDINSKETVRLAAEENAPGDEQAMIEQIAAIYRRIEALPEQGRRIFKMICIEHKSYVETARLLSLSLHTVKTHMSRSFKALRKIVDVLPHAFLGPGQPESAPPESDFNPTRFRPAAPKGRNPDSAFVLQSVTHLQIFHKKTPALYVRRSFFRSIP